MSFDFTDGYWVVNNHNPTTQVYSSASNAYVANTSAAYLTWLGLDNNIGFSALITGAADNGGGLIRLTVDTSQLQTGQEWRVNGNDLVGLAAAVGNWTITVIDATHLDLQASTYNAGDPWVSGGVLQGAAITATEADLWAVFNTYNKATSRPASFVTSSAVDVTLTNPLAFYNDITITAATTKKVILPNMRAPGAIPIGQPFVVRVKWTNGQYTSIYATDGTTVVAIADYFDEITHVLSDNSTANGTFTQSFNFNAKAASYVHGHQGSTLVSNVQYLFTFYDALLRDANGNTKAIGSVSSVTVDITTAGPAAGGRDQAGAFGVSSDVHLYTIWGTGKTTSGIASLTAANAGGPTLPTGYTHWALLTVLRLDGATHFFPCYIQGSWIYFSTRQQVLTAGTATSYTSFNFLSCVPVTYAASAEVHLSGTVTTNAGGGASDNLKISLDGTNDTIAMRVSAGQASDTATQEIAFIHPSVATNYKWQSIAGGANIATRSANAYVLGYQVPNGS